MIRKISLFILLISTFTSAVADELNVYSARKEQLIKPLLDRFSEETGIRVNLLTGKSETLLTRLESEGNLSPADILITTDAGRLHRAKLMKLLQPVDSPVLNRLVPETMRDRDGHWYGLSIRSRPIMYARNRVKPKDLSTYENLASDRWKGRICLRSSDSIYNQSLVASMIIANGEASAEQWIGNMVENLARTPAGGDIDQLRMVAAGLCDVAVVNTYYLGIMSRGSDKKQRKASKRIAVFWPNQSDRGAHINVSGAGVTTASSNPEAAVRLLEFLLGEHAQSWYARVNFEYPVREDIPWPKLLKRWGEFKSDAINLTRLGEVNPRAVRIMDRAGWR
ncbi:MAG: Fe(3+) ABC transporter substrate-binding protein [Pseudomonadota bacterium]